MSPALAIPLIVSVLLGGFFLYEGFNMQEDFPGSEIGLVFSRIGFGILILVNVIFLAWYWRKRRFKK